MFGIAGLPLVYLGLLGVPLHSARDTRWLLGLNHHLVILREEVLALSRACVSRPAQVRVLAEVITFPLVAGWVLLSLPVWVAGGLTAGALETQLVALRRLKGVQFALESCLVGLVGVGARLDRGGVPPWLTVVLSLVESLWGLILRLSLGLIRLVAFGYTMVVLSFIPTSALGSSAVQFAVRVSLYPLWIAFFIVKGVSWGVMRLLLLLFLYLSHLFLASSLGSTVFAAYGVLVWVCATFKEGALCLRRLASSKLPNRAGVYVFFLEAVCFVALVVVHEGR